MKKIQDIIGLPLISIDEAINIGEIKDILIDPNEGKVKYLLIMDAKWYLGAKLISFDRILSIGDDAVTIQNQKDLQKFCEVEDAIRLAEKGIKIVSARVFTEKGQYIGTVKEYYVSQEDGTICRCQLDGAHGLVMIDYPKIISFGIKTLVVEESIEEQKVKSKDELDTQAKSSTKLFEEKQRQFLIGRKAKRRILDESDNILLEEGQILTSEILDRVNDKNKIIELTINTI